MYFNISYFCYLKFFFNLLPNFSEKGDKGDKGDDEEKSRKRREETEKILSQFRSLTSRQQEEQRKSWNEELKLVNNQNKIELLLF